MHPKQKKYLNAAKFYLGQKLDFSRCGQQLCPCLGCVSCGVARGLVQGVALHVPGIRADCCGSL